MFNPLLRGLLVLGSTLGRTGTPYSIDPSNPKVVDVTIEQKTSSVAMAFEDCGTHAGIQLPVKELPSISVCSHEVSIC